MNNKQIEQLKCVLLNSQKELVVLQKSSATARVPVRLDQQSVGRVSRIDAMQQQAMAQAQDRQRGVDLGRIKQALRRIKNNDFGYCLSCEEKIAFNRLLIDPSVSHCIKCAGA
ncbi:MAG: TraR/DksA C4-type zinc finger protein [Devosiaceae bacterium]|nr:TraR/DksA C4-type zinc finger protein [Devosiaceae bacterium]